MLEAPPRTIVETHLEHRGVSLTPFEQVSLHHPGGGLLYLSTGGDFTRHALRRRGEYLNELEGVPGCYFTPNPFRSGSKGRKGENVTRLTCLFADVDDHTGGEVDPASMLLEACTRIEQAGLPLPTYYTETGRGLHLFWMLEESLPAERMRKIWLRVMREIAGTVGGDGATVTVNQYLRLSRTYNPAAGKIARSYLLTGARYAFQTFVDTLLPIARESLEVKKAGKKGRVARPIGKPTASANKPKGSWRHRKHYIRLARFLDYVMASRGYEITIPAGERHAFMLPYSCCLYQTHGENGYGLAYDLYSRLTNLPPDTIARRLTGVFDGERAYRWGFETVADRIGATPAEVQAFLEAEAEKKRENDRAYRETERREAGMVPRLEYLQAVQARKAEALHLHAEGLTVREIAERQGVTTRTVRGYLLEANTEGVNTPPNRPTPKYSNHSGDTLFHPAPEPCLCASGATLSVPFYALDHAPWLPSPPPM